MSINRLAAASERRESLKRFTDAGRKAIQEDNLYAALTIALTLPDVCATLEDPSARNVGARYTKWCQQWLVPTFTTPAGPNTSSHEFISAAEFYYLRCSLVHAGKSAITKRGANGSSKRKEFRFFDKKTGSHLNAINNCTVNGIRTPDVLQLKADLFSESVFSAVDLWDVSVSGDAGIQARKSGLLFISSPGTSFHDAPISFG